MSTLGASGHGAIKDGGIGGHPISSHVVEELQCKLPVPGLFCRADEAGVGDCVATVALIDLRSTSQCVS